MDKRVTEEHVEAALAAWWGLPNTISLGTPPYENARTSMRRVLEQFAASAPAQGESLGVNEFADLLVKAAKSRGLVLVPAAPAPISDDVKAEPVAWRWRYEGEPGWTIARKRPEDFPGMEVQPLYTRAEP
jgi:hypothetical protein